MHEMPEELYERLAAAFERTLFTSDLMQEPISGINDEAYEISLGLWAKGSKSACDEGLSDDVGQPDCDWQLGLFDGEPRPMPGELQFELRLTDEDVQFLRSIGVIETFLNARDLAITSGRCCQSCRAEL
jgi:hypothetical protein